MNNLEKINPTEIEKVRKIVKKYHFDGFPIISLDYAYSRLRNIIDDIEGFQLYDYDLYDVEQYHGRDGSTVYRGYLEVTYLSVEREIYFLRY
jgi:hypothetical protein